MSNIRGRNVLVLGGGLQGISVSYSLCKIGCNVYVYSSESAFKFSKSVIEVVYFSLSEESIIAYILTNDISVIIPMSDKLALWLSEKKETIENMSNAKCAVPDYNVILKASSKSDLMLLCSEHDLPVPRTKKIVQEKDINDICEYVGFPALIKPDHSVGARGIVKVNSVDDVIKVFPAIKEKFGACSLQEYINNKDYYYNVMLYRYGNGRCSASVIIKITRFYPLDGGSSCLCETVNMPELEMICSKILKLLNWEGFADFDVLYDKTTEQFKVIEINPRVPASLRAADISGVNFPQIIVSDKLCISLPEITYRPGMTLRYLGLDILWFFKSKQRFKSKPSWFKFFGKTLYYQDLYIEDKKMSVFMMWEGIKKLFRHE